jgi:small subunit ribosomal protein S8
MKQHISEILKKEGFIRDFAVEGEGTKKRLKLALKYVNGESVIHEIKSLSTPGKPVYRGITGLKPVIGGLGVSILTTSHGIMTDKQARALNIGGKLLCELW